MPFPIHYVICFQKYDGCGHGRPVVTWFCFLLIRLPWFVADQDKTTVWLPHAALALAGCNPLVFLDVAVGRRAVLCLEIHHIVSQAAWWRELSTLCQGWPVKIWALSRPVAIHFWEFPLWRPLNETFNIWNDKCCLRKHWHRTQNSFLRPLHRRDGSGLLASTSLARRQRVEEQRVI